VLVVVFLYYYAVFNMPCVGQLMLIVHLCVASNVSTTIDPFWDISLDLGPPDFEGWFCFDHVST